MDQVTVKERNSTVRLVVVRTEDALKSFKKGKAPAPDEILIEAFQKLEGVGAEILT